MNILICLKTSGGFLEVFNAAVGSIIFGGIFEGN